MLHPASRCMPSRWPPIITPTPLQSSLTLTAMPSHEQQTASEALAAPFGPAPLPPPQTPPLPPLPTTPPHPTHSAPPPLTLTQACARAQQTAGAAHPVSVRVLLRCRPSGWRLRCRAAPSGTAGLAGNCGCVHTSGNSERPAPPGQYACRMCEQGMFWLSQSDNLTNGTWGRAGECG